MMMKRKKLAMIIGGVLFLSMPLASAFAHEQHCEIKDTQLGTYMKHMKSELRAYVKGFKADDQEQMQAHLNELLKLSALASQQTPVKIANMHAMDHAQMDDNNMPEMDHSQMNDSNMPAMDHSQMNDNNMPEMDHSQMNDSNMPAMDHSKMNDSNMPAMAGMSSEQHSQHMLYQQGMSELEDLFQELDQTQDETEIKTILGEIKEHIKKSHQQFRQNCA